LSHCSSRCLGPRAAATEKKRFRWRFVSGRCPPSTRVLSNAGAGGGTQSDLNYKWFAVHGDCDPQETNTPVSMFKFSARHKEDVVTVEVWRGSKRLAQNYLVVDETPAVSSGSNRCIKIEITEIPPAEEGGPPRGRISPEEYRGISHQICGYYSRPATHVRSWKVKKNRIFLPNKQDAYQPREFTFEPLGWLHFLSGFFGFEVMVAEETPASRASWSFSGWPPNFLSASDLFSDAGSFVFMTNGRLNGEEGRQTKPVTWRFLVIRDRSG